MNRIYIEMGTAREGFTTRSGLGLFRVYTHPLTACFFFFFFYSSAGFSSTNALFFFFVFFFFPNRFVSTLRKNSESLLSRAAKTTNPERFIECMY